jgi:hypothetical protein
MSNMSYCRFQNTSIDLQDCLYAMEEEESFADMDLSNEESYAMLRMKDQCERFLELFEELRNCPLDFTERG